MINLSRNSPVAIVFGAAGFIASHVIEKLLEKRVQVIGIDDLSTGFKNNLLESFKDRSFHFIFSQAEKDLVITVPRLDYAIFCLDEDNDQLSYISSFKNFLMCCMGHNKGGVPKIVLLSSINLYNKKYADSALREAERLLAKYTSDNKANARIVRLVPIFGPRMHFREEDPIVDLILAAIKGEVQKEPISLDFTTRALYIEDAVALLLKALFSGATAQKIYDGAQLYPIKVAEIKQVLLDPIWHEVKRFTPTELPPWPTPNLEKTQKELAWTGDNPIVTSLKHTLAFFRENPDRIPKEGVLEGKKIEPIIDIQDDKMEKPQPTHKAKSFNLDFIKKQASIFLGLILIMYALVYPGLGLVFGSLSIRYHLGRANHALILGDFTNTQKEIEFSHQAVNNIREVFSSVEIIKSLGLFKDSYRSLDVLLLSLEQIISGSKHLNLGIQDLHQLIGSITGEGSLDTKEHFVETGINLSTADVNFSESLARLQDLNLTKFIPPQIKDRLEDLQAKVNQFQKNTQSLRFINSLLEQIIALDGSKTYLVMLQNNLEINSGGGQIISLSTVKFDKGKLTSLNIEDRVDLKAIPSINSEPDFPTNAKLITHHFNQTTGLELAGVVSLDLTAYEYLLEAVGPLELNGLMVDQNNIKVLTKQKIDDKKFINQFHRELLNKILFAPKSNLGKIASALERSINQKNAMIFISDKATFSRVIAAGWSSHFPQGVKDDKGERSEFLSINETNLSSTSAKIFKKTIQLDSTILDNQLNNKLTINYLNGEDKLRLNLKIYLTAGSKLNQQVRSFFDYGRSGYSWDLELAPNEQKHINLEYSNIKPLEFTSNQLKFRLDVLKQAGVGADSFEYRLTVPVGVTIQNHKGPTITFSTDLSTDRSFEVTLIK